MQAEALFLLIAWAAVLGWLAWSRPRDAQLVWLLLVAAVLLSPILAWIWPWLR